MYYCMCVCLLRKDSAVLSMRDKQLVCGNLLLLLLLLPFKICSRNKIVLLSFTDEWRSVVVRERGMESTQPQLRSLSPSERKFS